MHIVVDNRKRVYDFNEKEIIKRLDIKGEEITELFKYLGGGPGKRVFRIETCEKVKGVV